MGIVLECGLDCSALPWRVVASLYNREPTYSVLYRLTESVCIARRGNHFSPFSILSPPRSSRPRGNASEGKAWTRACYKMHRERVPLARHRKG